MEITKRIERIENVLGKLITWSVRELGEAAARELLSELAKDRCTSCGSEDVAKGHHDGTSLGLPECDFSRCENCNHQWDHA